MKWYKNLTLEKDPSDVLDYQLDFKQLLQSDVISTAAVVADNVTIDSTAVSGNVVTIFISGGSAGTIATVTTTIVTTNATPRTYERSFKIKVEDL